MDEIPDISAEAKILNHSCVLGAECTVEGWRLRAHCWIVLGNVVLGRLCQRHFTVTELQFPCTPVYKEAILVTKKHQADFFLAISYQD